MANHYVTLGQNHAHRCSNVTVDCNCVVVFQAASAEEGRKKAFELFGDKFSFEYHDTEFNLEDMKYYPRGLIQL